MSSRAVLRPEEAAEATAARPIRHRSPAQRDLQRGGETWQIATRTSEGALFACSRCGCSQPAT